MNHEQRERLVDSALDRALGPQLVEPRDGFEERILSNLPKQAERRPWWQWMWIPALAAAAVLAVVIGMKITHRDTPAPVQANKTIEARQQEVAVKPEVKKVHPSRVMAKHSPPPKVVPTPAVNIAVAEPRLDVFPSRGTLTPEERLLVAFVRQQPGHARSVALEQEARAEEVQQYLEKGQVPAAGPSGITTK